MINPSFFFNLLTTGKIEFFTGVPDSTLKEICACINDNAIGEEHIITANEGNAIAIAAGYHLSSGKIGLVYMQNSGLGNAINPLTSLADKEVYQIPMLLMIGWRGQPGVKDEPQHIKKGMITLELLKLMGIPYKILSKESQIAKIQLQEMVEQVRQNNYPGAIIVQSDTFEEYKGLDVDSNLSMSREEAIGVILDRLGEEDIIISTTGKTSREVYEYREKRNQTHEREFLTVGSMGHASSIGLGIALQKKDRRIIVFDGDGAAIMHLGALATIGNAAAGTFRHVILNNGAHESVGGQPTVGFGIDLPTIAKACNYKKVYSANSKDELLEVLDDFLQTKSTNLLEVKVRIGSRKDLGRPKTTPVENKQYFMSYVSK